MLIGSTAFPNKITETRYVKVKPTTDPLVITHFQPPCAGKASIVDGQVLWLCNDGENVYSTPVRTQ
jgi:hypothetical protein